MATMQKPCRLEWSNASPWELLGTFDAACEDDADDILTCAGRLADALNAANRRKSARLRVSTDEPLPVVLMFFETDKGWMKPNGEAA